ncbi:hypothetical protein BpHYR1_042789 [Brachionus plicatilis]|uniref:Uncharacterized protein n=1 Tax=Brachionus plicatilis TaxID=10195 RepID=A0A3M7SQP2_BRAPC|nr:hypothetical protein BpHYR1_042789 [Brachionus plicatilis]
MINSNLEKIINLKNATKNSGRQNCILVRIFKQQPNIEKASGVLLGYLGSICNIPTEDCKDFRNFDEFEINGVITVFIFHRKRKFELLAELLAKDVRIEKPGILLTAPFDEPGPLTQEPIPELISEDVVADENTPTTSSDVVESSGDEEEQLPKQLTRASLKRKMTISKSFEMLSVRDDHDWLNLQRKQSNNDSLNRMARDNFAKNEEVIFLILKKIIK